MHSLYRTEALRALEAGARASLPPGTLMERAGQAAAAWILASGPVPGNILVLCGPGDNGGDGYCCALALRAAGQACRCWAPLPSQSPDARAARAQWQATGGETLHELPEAQGIGLVVDALLGIGAARPLREPLLPALHWARDHQIPVAALDLPSGLDPDTGAWIGGVKGVDARRTLTFLADKPGLHTLDGLQACGKLTIDHLGVQVPAGPGRLNAPLEFAALCAARPRNTNKGDFGSLAVIGGATGMVGAALLAARAGLLLGAGKVFAACVGAPDLAVDPLYPELMLRSAPDLPQTDALVVGCGLGTDSTAHTLTRAALASLAALVLDADALNCIASDAGLQQTLHARGLDHGGVTVLTPHPGEAARLLGCTTVQVQADRVASALELARRSAALVVLKGAGSIIAAPDGTYAVNPTGTPALASAGTGDVLAGMTGALLAQSQPAASAWAATWAATCAATWLHGRAAELHGADLGLPASAIAALAARALGQLRPALPGH